MAKPKSKSSPRMLPGAAEPIGPPATPEWVRRALRIVMGLGAVFLLWTFSLAASLPAQTRELANQGWGQVAGVIAGNKLAAVGHATFMLLFAVAALWLMMGRLAAHAQRVAMVLLVIVAIDAYLLSRHYIRPMPLAGLQENEVVRLLKQAGPERRVAMIAQDGFYNYWLTFLFPYHDIKSVNFTQMPRMPEDYKRFLAALASQPLRMWELAAVEFVLAPAQVWGQIQNTPGLKDRVRLAFAYNVKPIGQDFQVVPATVAQPGQHAVLEVTAPSARLALLAGWEPASDDAALNKLADPTWAPYQRALVSPEQAEGWPALAGAGVTGSVELIHYRAGRMDLKVNADVPAILRISEKYDPNWKAWINGQPATLRRIDYLFQGLFVEAGTSQVELRYAPPTWTVWIQVSGLVLFALALASALLRRTPCTATERA